MAGDWIKMRIDLATSPKVVRIASALRADRLRVIGGLHAVWCLFDVHSADGHLDGYTLDALDELIGFPGFGAAMVSVGWLEDAGDSLCTPRFEEHNGQSAKRRAMETERKREARKTSAPDADKKRTREEKRREEKKEAKASSSAYAPPDWVPVEQWAEFVQMRKAMRNIPFTDAAAKGVVSDLEKLKDAGHSPSDLLSHAVTNGWRTVYAPKPGSSAQPNKLQALEDRNREVARKWAEDSRARV